MVQKISPHPSLPKRGIIPPFCKACLPVGRGGEEGFAFRCLYYRLINKSQGNLKTQYVIPLTVPPTNSQSSNLPAGPLSAPMREARSVILLSVHSEGFSIRATLGPRS